jgi:hypothetical protein
VQATGAVTTYRLKTITCTPPCVPFCMALPYITLLRAMLPSCTAFVPYKHNMAVLASCCCPADILLRCATIPRNHRCSCFLYIAEPSRRCSYANIIVILPRLLLVDATLSTVNAVAHLFTPSLRFNVYCVATTISYLCAVNIMNRVLFLYFHYCLLFRYIVGPVRCGGLLCGLFFAPRWWPNRHQLFCLPSLH